MSFTKKYVPPLLELKKEIDTNPDIIKYYAKYEAFIGDSDSLEFLYQVINPSPKLNPK
jgi:hypothetical protein